MFFKDDGRRTIEQEEGKADVGIGGGLDGHSDRGLENFPLLLLILIYMEPRVV